MIKRNPNLAALATSYLFPQIHQRKREFQEQNPEAKVISLGIGDTTEPLASSITGALVDISQGLKTKERYIGYGPEQGIEPLRKKIASQLYGNKISSDEVFVSDGAKCDLGRLQVLFGGDITVGVQDPAYPVYIDGSLIQGVKSIHSLPCYPKNGFFPDLNLCPKVDLLYFCSPNNPTGAVLTYPQMEELVAFAKKNRMVILFDAAYASYIRDPKIPKTIYEVPGAKEVAIEIGSFSKLAGFTGVRLGWTIVPENIKYENGASIRNDWNRINTTLFNGASIIAQCGGMAALEPKGRQEIDAQISFYLENAKLIKEALLEKGYTVYGGDHAPYLWVRFPKMTSWEAFQMLLEKAHIVTTPGSGFGPKGDGFLRFSAYGKRENILEAADRIKKLLVF